MLFLLEDADDDDGDDDKVILLCLHIEGNNCIVWKTAIATAVVVATAVLGRYPCCRHHIVVGMSPEVHLCH